jgi:P-type Cu2+ transporter
MLDPLSAPEAESGPAGSASRDAGCFHCGLPLEAGSALPSLEVLGVRRSFCCYGCLAVCKAIVDFGLEDYYRHRTESPGPADRPMLSEFLDRLDLYDYPDVQKDFVREGENWCEASLILEDIRCPACLWLNERRIRSLHGVVDVSIDVATQRARVRWDPEVIRLSEILKAVADIGYIAHPYDPTRYEHLTQARKRRSIERLIFSGLVGMMVMNFSFATYLAGPPNSDGQLPLWITIGRWTSLFAVTTILVYPGQDFFLGAWNDIRNRRLGMDIPIVVGLVAAYLGSLYATASGGAEVYFDSIAMFVFFLLLSRRWEMEGRLRAAGQLERLSCVTPRTARRLDASNRWQAVPASELAPGDRIRVLPGETLPVDGILVTGVSSFDESLLTGEALPVRHGPGDAAVAGSVNGDEPVILRVSHGVQASAVSEMRRLVERGLAQRPGYALLAERVASWFVAAQLAIASGTALFWLWAQPTEWLSSTIAVLIVTCPCALALATPVTLAVAARRLLVLGILPLRMRALDSLALSDLFAFDKTGTLTEGRLSVVAVIPTGGLTREQILEYAAALSAASEHPVARALRKAVPAPHIGIEEACNVSGSGVSGVIEGAVWWFGNSGLIADGVSLPAEIGSLVAREQSEGNTVSLLGNRDGVQAVLSFADSLRPGLEKMLARLRETGVTNVAILSGDHPLSVQKTGQRLGIETLRGGMSSADKAAWIQAMQRGGHRVVMFGDGINDAPALAVADASVSFSGATDLANTHSDFLILRADPGLLCDARAVARHTRAIIIQNFGWAVMYNLIAVPLAVLGWVAPWGAAIGMSLSSLVVVANALRPQAFRPVGAATISVGDGLGAKRRDFERIR